MSGTNPPAVTVLFVSGLVNPDFLIEIDATLFPPRLYVRLEWCGRGKSFPVRVRRLGIGQRLRADRGGESAVGGRRGGKGGLPCRRGEMNWTCIGNVCCGDFGVIALGVSVASN